MNSVILAGGGTGTRLKNKVSKTFTKIKGRELFYYSLEKFYNSIDEIFLVLPEKDLKIWAGRIKKEFPGINILAGGKQRQDSVNNALKRIKGKGLILIHDVARPFFTYNLVKKLLSEGEKYGACVPFIEMCDTVKEIKNGFVSRTLDRNKLAIIQTPQCFRVDILKTAYRKAYKENFYGSDDSVLVERIGEKIRLVKGERNNIKITYPEDLKKLEENTG
jgi:2-C-methyl-D-erythritol 4-phosphate cytidylyltransferase